jgi:hypothetical protein
MCSHTFRLMREHRSPCKIYKVGLHLKILTIHNYKNQMFRFKKLNTPIFP